MARNDVRFVRWGRIVERRDFDPAETLLDHLRIRERACGTKEGCAEGDCGACTVALGRLDGNGRVTYQPVNSCILLLGMIDGAEIVTVEDLASSNGQLHPVQRAMVDLHASQCGFCTPGFVMSLFTLYHTGKRVDRATVNDWLAGNLCRCTGYRPIADAALASCTGQTDDAFTERAGETAALLAGLSESDDVDLLVGNDESFFAAPATEDALAAFCARHPDATIGAGATDVGLWVHQAAPRPPAHGTYRPRRLPARGSGGGRPGRDRRPPRPTPRRKRRSAGSIRTWARCCAASARSRCAPPAPSAATSPTARRSGIRRRC